MILKMIIIPMLVKTLLATRNPILCAALYGACLFTNSLIFDLAFSNDWAGVLFNLTGATGLSFAYFWALKEFESGPLYFATLIVGTGLLLYLF
jgi:hypothetical protein